MRFFKRHKKRDRSLSDLFCPKPKRPVRLFGFITLIIAACVTGFVVIIYISMIKGAVNESDYVRIIEGGVPTQIRAIAFEMERWASHIAGDPRVKELAAKGAQYLENGGTGKNEASGDNIRRNLLNRIFSRWGRLSEGPRPKDVQILLGPELTSFLWMNQPDRFGFMRKDRSALLNESLQTRGPVSGFET